MINILYTLLYFIMLGFLCYKSVSEQMNHLMVSNRCRPWPLETPEAFWRLGIWVIEELRVMKIGEGSKWASGNLTHTSKQKASVVLHWFWRLIFKFLNICRIVLMILQSSFETSSLLLKTWRRYELLYYYLLMFQQYYLNNNFY